MSGSCEFSNWLAPYFERFVALRRAGGFLYLSQARLLRAFARYLNAHATEAPFREETLSRYLVSLDHLSPRAWDNVVAVVWQALAHTLRHGAPIEALPARPPKPSRHWRQREPRILTLTEIRCWLAAARQLPPAGGLRPATTATLIGLLYTTGLRIGEALALDIGDLDPGDRILIVREGKFGKSRALPLRESTVQALDQYLRHPCRKVSIEPSAPIFVSCRRRRLADPTAWQCMRPRA